MEYYYKNHEQELSKYYKYRKNDPDRFLAYRLKKYGLTVEQYKKFGNKCMICNRVVEEIPNLYRCYRTRLCVDHDSITKTVRVVLCGNCNIGLGLFEHSSIFLENAAKYIKKFERGDDNARKIFC